MPSTPLPPSPPPPRAGTGPALNGTPPALSNPAEPGDGAAQELERDEVLVERSQGGDIGAFDRLVERYKERIYRLAYQMTSQHEDANDLAQETFIKAFRSIRSFRGRSSFYTWIYRIALNLTLNHLKKASRQRSLSLDEMDGRIQLDPDFLRLSHGETPMRGAALTELRQRLNEAMQKLTANHRAVVTMHDIEGMTHAEIASILGISEGTVRSRLFYARQQLQGLLADYQ